MKNMKKVVSIICVLCLLMNLLISNAAGDLNMDTEEMVISNRVPVLTLTPGSGVGQVGYGGNESSGYAGPDSFAVENGIIYILDSLNKRVMLFGNGNYASIDTSDVPYARRMKCENGKIAVVDNTYGLTGVYSVTGDQLALISHPDFILDEFVHELVEIGDTYVVWKTYDNSLYQYDWVEENIEELDVDTVMDVSVSDNAAMNIASINSTTGAMAWQIDTENKVLDVHGVAGTSLVYEQYEVVPDVDMFFAELSVRKVDVSGSETYAVIDFSDWKSYPLEPLYLSSDGEVYLMECFEENMIISRVVLGTTDVSHMNELEMLAANRRLELAELEANSEINSSSITHTSSRAIAEYRAEGMINLRWQVLANHKISPYSDVIVPQYVKNASVGDWVTGIPYCWGGYNGYSAAGSYARFSDLVTSTEHTAGNLGSTSRIWASPGKTIGLDCSGFAGSVYVMGGTKYDTTSFSGFGHAVSVENLKKMDFLVKPKPNGHISIWAGTNSGDMMIYEADVLSDNSLDGFTMRTEWTIALLANTDGYGVSGAYSCRSLFHENCDRDGDIEYTSEGHYDVCYVCDYAWPMEDHIYDSWGVCTECEYNSVIDMR